MMWLASQSSDIKMLLNMSIIILSGSKGHGIVLMHKILY